MRVVVDDTDGKRGDEIARLFAAELRARHIAVCNTPAEGAPPPLGVVAVRTSSEAAFVEVDVRDDLTAKSLKREVALADVPSDVRALTVAVAADELLRASWAELAVKSAFSAKQQEKVPAEVRDVVRDTMVDVPKRDEPRIAFGAGAVLDAFTGGSTLLGADVLADAWIVPRLRIVARFGLRSGLSARGADGDVSTSAISFKLGAALTLTPPQLRAGLDLALRAGAMRVAFVATPSTGASAQSLADTAVLADAALLGWVKLAPNLRALADAAFSVPLRSVVATDGADVVTGVSGVGVSATLGLWGTF
ncbi:MAG TPA: hypothetical protein VH054_22530 [Polyangiaceae bacterium]|nr:hypothetical protein [Polyangiaceae bacterium]